MVCNFIKALAPLCTIFTLNYGMYVDHCRRTLERITETWWSICTCTNVSLKVGSEVSKLVNFWQPPWELKQMVSNWKKMTNHVETPKSNWH